jgi:hypothetical protein
MPGQGFHLHLKMEKQTTNMNTNLLGLLALLIIALLPYFIFLWYKRVTRIKIQLQEEQNNLLKEQNTILNKILEFFLHQK